MDMSSQQSAREHYEFKGLLGRIEIGLEKIGLSKENITLDQLAQVDEFHFRGLAATKELIPRLEAKPGDNILDAGSGLGGPARQLAATTGCTVIGLDLSKEYQSVGKTLNSWTGLSNQVDLQQGDVTDLSRFADNSFDGSWTIHVGMNVADKAGFYNEIHRVLKPGAKFVIYDVVLQEENLEIHYPMPWAQSADHSYLLTAIQLQAALTDQGFQILDSKDQTAEGINFVDTFLARIQGPEGPPPLGLGLILGPIVKEIIPNMKRNLAEGRIGLRSIVCKK